MIIIESAEELKQYAKDVTAKKRAEDATKPKVEIHPMVKELTDVISASELNSYKEDVVQLCNIFIKNILSEEQRITLDESHAPMTYVRFSVVVPLEKAGSHNYTIDEPFLVINPNASPTGIKINGAEGNCHHGAWRYATDEEVAMYFYTLPEAHLNSIFNSISIV